MFELLFYPIAIGLLIAAVGGPLGSLIIWQRMAYFGESIAHSALLGVALGLFFQADATITVVAVCCVMALLLSQLHRYLQLSLNTLLAIMAHTSLAVGLVIISLVPSVGFNIENFLFGDLLTLSKQEFIGIALIAGLSMSFIVWRWQGLIALVANEELASIEGVNTRVLETVLMLVMALVIAVGIKAVGVLLIVSLLIIPAASARKWVGTPEAMALLASLLGVCAVLAGLGLSYFADTPAGPSIVAIAGMIYFVSQIILLCRKV